MSTVSRESPQLPEQTGIEPAPGEYRVQAPAEISSLLRQMLEQQIRITLTSPAGATLNGRMCLFDPDLGVLGVDVMAHDPELQPLLASDEIAATCYLDQIRVAFELEGPVLVNGPRGAVLRAPLPLMLHRFQRRQSFRVKPSSRTPQARLRLDADPQGAEQRLRIVDLSVGGIALLLAAGDGGVVPELGTELEAHVELDRENHFRALLQLQHVSGAAGDEKPSAGAAMPAGLKLGFAWARLSPDAQRQVQLFIDQTQRMNRLLRKS
ncbi:flagellar regulator YcgR PilZN domain-containing protein [Paucibacter sp. R3-3]|uniref:Flagellar regulator YcgR PilZN domain-containing protein n=1 Tax=Roseateles agri TaxID=3098619 RepID=A0ABU5DT97_9BURK|nr:flagellar regulator YcgR PilZN domain-containing protein [Paucibacter sp. R3-3]MDY0748407.1 flagellar regulator YcgR PilZN domain-containing protein [Paucibacter sp. R3-3]